MTVEHTTIPLVDRHGYTVAEALVDADLADWLNQWEWHLCDGYARRSVSVNGQTKVIRMHRLIAGVPADSGSPVTVDHINGNPLDNRRENLRWATHTQQSINRAPVAGKRFKGVYKNSNANSYTVRIKAPGAGYIGSYRDPEVAARAYDRAVLRLRGDDYPRLNFPEDRDQYLAEMVGAVGLEPTANGLKGRCSTD